jgi:hypothetical protein
MTTALSVARTGLLQDMQMLYSSTTTSAGAADGSTLVDAALSDYPDSHFVGLWFFIPGTPASRQCVGHIGSTATMRRPFAAQVPISTAYQYYEHFSPDEIKAALNSAMSDTGLWPILYKPVIDNALTILADTYQYTKPSSITGDVLKIEQEVDTTNATKSYAEIPLAYWSVVDNGTTKKIQFEDDAPIITGRKLKVYGQAALSAFTNEASTTEIDAPLLGILYAATALRLANIKAGVGPNASPFWAAIAAKAAQDLEARMRKIQQPQEPVKIAGLHYTNRVASW